MHRTAVFGVVLGVLLALLIPTPVDAHSGGRVQLWPQSFTMTAADAGWRIDLVLIDRDSGTKATGFGVTVNGVDPSQARFGPMTLTALANGAYTGTVTGIEAGPWTVTVVAGPIPGSEDAEILNRTYEVALDSAPGSAAPGVEAQGAALAGATTDDEGGGGALPAFILIGAGIGATAALTLGRRRGRLVRR